MAERGARERVIESEIVEEKPEESRKEKVIELDTYLSNISLYYDQDTCKACGMCEIVCPKDAIELGPSGAIGKGVSELPSVNVDEEDCVLCGICDAICPFGAFELVVDGEHELPVIDLEAFPELIKEVERDLDKCVTCPWCEDVCPNDAITVEKVMDGEIEIDTSKCPSNCTVCLDICPCDAIYEPESEEGWGEENSLAVKEKFCIYCGACVRACPVEGAITLERDEIKVEEIESLVWDKSKEDLTERIESEESEIEARKIAPKDMGEKKPETEEKEKVAELDTLLTNFSLYFEEDSCKACGMCEIVCPKDAIEIGSFTEIEEGVVELPSVNVDEEDCVLCGICDAICPFGAFELVVDGEHELPVIDLEAFPELIKEVERDLDKCVTCPWCEDVCPNDAITVEKVMDGEIEIDTSKCPSNCTVCLDICPCDAIYEPESEEGWGEENSLAVKEKFCIYCGACVRACPVEGAITLERDEIKVEEIESLVWDKSKEDLTERIESRSLEKPP